jgi:hypothetical protein
MAVTTMSDEYTPFSGRQSGSEKPTLVKRVWHVRHPRSGKILSCGLYLHPLGIECAAATRTKTTCSGRRS